MSSLRTTTCDALIVPSGYITSCSVRRGGVDSRTEPKHSDVFFYNWSNEKCLNLRQMLPIKSFLT